MTREELLTSIIDDLGANYREDRNGVLESLLDETISDALFISNRNGKNVPEQLDILAADIRRAVKSIYLLRGSEDAVSRSELGISSSYDDVKDRLRRDIIRGGKRLLI